MIIEWQSNLAGFAGNHTYFGTPWLFQSRISATSETTVVDTGAGEYSRRRYILPNGIKITATEAELDAYLLPFTRPERKEVIAASTPAKPIKVSTVAPRVRPVMAAIVPVEEEPDYQQIALLLLL